MTKREILQLVLIFGIALLLFFLGRTIKQQKRSIVFLEQKVNDLKIDSSVLQLERWSNTLALRENNIALPSNLPLILNDTIYTINKFVKEINSPKIIIRFSYLSCGVCVDSTLFTLKSANIGDKNISIWASYDNERNLHKFKNINRLTYETFFCPEQDTLLTADLYMVPYMFILLPGDSNVHDLFFPMKENTTRTKDYLNIVLSKYHIL